MLQQPFAASIICDFVCGQNAFVASPPYVLLHSRALTLFCRVGRAFQVVPDEIISPSQEYAPEVT